MNIAFDDANGFTDCLKTHNFESDHKAVELCLSESFDNILKCPARTIIDFENINFIRFNEILENNLDANTLPLNRIASTNEINNCILSINEAFNQAINSDAIPRIKTRNKGLITLPQEILNWISEKKRLRRAAYRCLDPRRKNIIEADIRNISKIISDRIRLHEDNYWAAFFANIKMDGKTYRKIKGLCGLQNKIELPDLVIDPTDHTDYDGGVIQSDSSIIMKTNIDKVNALAKNFENIHKQNRNIGSVAHTQFVDSSISDISNNRNPIITFNEVFKADGNSNFSYVDRINNEVMIEKYNEFCNHEDIRIVISFLNNKKSFGEDNISNFLLKKTRIKFWRLCALLFNHCFNIGYFPDLWKCAKIIAIPKPSTNQNSIRNYRPISLLSNVGKLFERFLLQKIKAHIQQNEILKDTQTGFRSFHSTNHALALVSDFVTDNLNKRNATIAVSLDLEKAFDTTWHEGIIYKMYKVFNFDTNICRILNDYLKERSFYVEHGDENSMLTDICAGVPQGSILAPYLFNIFLADLPQPTQSDLMQNAKMLSLSYADDILILASHQHIKKANKALNKYIEELTKYFSRWRLKLNPNKCECTVFKGILKYLYPNARKYTPHIQIENNIVIDKQQIKYLGVVLQEKFTFKLHFDYILKKAKNVFFAYSNLIKRAKDLKSNIKINIYKQIIRPILGYAFPCWFNVSSAQMERLRVFERYILRICSGLNRQTFNSNLTFRKRISNKKIYNKCKIKRIDCFLIENGLRFLNNLPYVENNLINEYYNKQHEISFPFSERYLSPIYLRQIQNQNLLYRDKKLLFYHRRYNTYNIENLVYNTDQFVK